MRLPIVFVAFYTCVALPVLPASGTVCGDLAKLTLPTTTISAAESVPAGPYTPPGSQAIGDAPAFCRVAGVIKPVEDSNIQFEVWMPASGWNGKFQGVGNGGFAGSINYTGLADSVRHGYAAASPDIEQSTRPRTKPRRSFGRSMAPARAGPISAPARTAAGRLLWKLSASRPT